jgi:hypothetical protein
LDAREPAAVPARFEEKSRSWPRFTPDALSPSCDGMADESDPPRKFYALKPREFEVVNQPKSTPSPDSAPTDVQGHLRAANAHGILHVTPKSSETSDVHAMLRDNLERENAAGLNDVTLPPKKRSRRKRDYWLMLLPVNAFFAWRAFGPGASVVTLVYGIGGMAFFTAALTWVMWFVLDDY